MLFLWNPSLKKSVGIRVPNYTLQPDSPKMIFGFGVRPDTLDPTLLKINYPYYDQGQAVVGGKIFWVGSENFNSDDGISYKNYMLVSFDLITHQFQVIAMPEQMLVREFLPPYYISQLGDSIIISGSFSFDDFRIIYAWDLEVDDGEVSSYRQLFTITYPAEHELKLLGFSKDKQPIVEAAIIQQWHQSLQVFNPSFQNFQNIGVEANSVLGDYRLPRVGVRIKRSWGLAVVEVEPAVVTSWRVLFIIPSQNIAKSIRFTRDKDPIVKVDSGQQMVHTLQVYDRPSQQFQNVGIEANGGSFFIGPSYKESLILLNIFNLDPNVLLNLSFNLPAIERDITNDEDVEFFIDCATNSNDEIPHLYVPPPKKPEARIIPGPTGILQKVLLRKNTDVMAGGHDNIMTTQEYIKKVNEDVSEDDVFTLGPWLRAIVYLHDEGVIAAGCLGDVEKYCINGKLEIVVGVVMSCTPNALGDMTITL
ncbi:hypothetical protein Tco_0873696 [Tanacetum coccineum]|uniref:Uncharacterized protein n=1 Tax=Tanacetum coccineum TaxID=301880 RepID=A0ABQ5BJM0_9ASTR